ncbi:MAG: PQQ-binding-like beta-propeller repeat protein [Pirellulaceae bacterium]|nr:PQQ-binding-like beta-propeller repeat protein [Pirellulaceae bacterium]
MAIRAWGLPITLVAVIGGTAWGGDWPQILGPQRNGVAEGERLAAGWPAGGPQRLWTCKLGSGYAGPAVVGGRVIVFHRVGDLEVVEALDVATGKSLWRAEFAANYRGGIDRDTGPRCVPLLAEGRVFAFGAAGDLYCVALDSGKKLWTRELYADYRGDEGYFGAGSTPILVAGKLLVNVGGRGAGLVALDPATGKTAWNATDEAASYSSPAAVTLAGQEQAIFITRLNCVLADPATGKVRTLFPFGQRGPTVNAATPLVVGDKLFVTASYNIGAQLRTLAGTEPQQLWASDDVLSSQYATPVPRDGFLYGIHGREDQGGAELRCLEAATGKVRWSEADFGVANLILAGDKLLLIGAGGKLALARATPERYTELAQHQVVRDVARALPALSAGRLYVRTGSGGGELICLAVGE